MSGAFDYAAPEGKAAGELRIFPQALINTTTNESATLQVPVVTVSLPATPIALLEPPPAEQKPSLIAETLHRM